MGFPATIFGAEKDAYETGSVQLYPIGQKMITPSGSIFRYAEMGATVGVANNLYQSEVPSANWLSQLVSTALAVGDTTIAFTDGGTAYSANDFAGGTILVEETDDLGHIYPIKSNAASAGTASASHTLVDGVTVQVAVAIAGGNVLTLLKNPWKDVIIHPSPPTALPTGIPRVIIAANGYGWVQTRGLASCLINGIVVISQPVAPSNAINGSVGAKRKSGTANVASGATTSVVTHNLGSTPTLDNISLTFGEQATSDYGRFWIDTLTATQFTVNVSVDPGVSNLDFSWIAEINDEQVGICVEVAPSADFGHIFLQLE